MPVNDVHTFDMQTAIEAAFATDAALALRILVDPSLRGPHANVEGSLWVQAPTYGPSNIGIVPVQENYGSAHHCRSALDVGLLMRGRRIA